MQVNTLIDYGDDVITDNNMLITELKEKPKKYFQNADYIVGNQKMSLPNINNNICEEFAEENEYIIPHNMQTWDHSSIDNNFEINEMNNNDNKVNSPDNNEMDGNIRIDIDHKINVTKELQNEVNNVINDAYNDLFDPKKNIQPIPRSKIPKDNICEIDNILLQNIKKYNHPIYKYKIPRYRIWDPIRQFGEKFSCYFCQYDGKCYFKMSRPRTIITEKDEYKLFFPNYTCTKCGRNTSAISKYYLNTVSNSTFNKFNAVLTKRSGVTLALFNKLTILLNNSGTIR